MLTIHAIPGRNIVLGIEGENFARSVVFNISDWIIAYGVGTVSLIAQRSGDTEPYPCTVTVDGSSVTWEVTAADTARNGYGKCELRYAVGDVLAKSETWITYTADALGTPAPEAPEPQKAWVDKVLEAGQAAVDASVNSPKIGSNGNWWTWDFEAGAYVDTGVAASGGGSGAVSSVNGKTGAVKLTAKDVGAVPVPETASVGQTIVVKAVGEAGKPTRWEAADMPSGGGSSLPATGVEDAGKVLTVTDSGVPGWADSGLADKLPKSPLDWEQWTSEEQAAAQERMGLGLKCLANISIDTEDGVSEVVISDWFEIREYKRLIAYVYIPSQTFDGNGAISLYGNKATISESIYNAIQSGKQFYCVFDVQIIDSNVIGKSTWGTLGRALDTQRIAFQAIHSAGKLSFYISSALFVKGSKLILWGEK